MIIAKKDLLPYIKSLLPDNPIILEAGAFDGKDTQRLSATWPLGTIHSFEPVPEIFELLQQSTKNCSNVHTYPLALSDSNGFQEFYVAEHPQKPGKPCQAGSLKKPSERLAWSAIRYPKTLQVPTTTLDNWAQQQAICRIDFAWLDLQGNELTVLKSSPNILKNITIILMEVNFINAYEGQSSYTQTLSWLKSQGFEVLAQDFADTNTWFFGNILVSKATRADLPRPLSN
jgi:FkbM family methyltransferase